MSQKKTPVQELEATFWVFFSSNANQHVLFNIFSSDSVIVIQSLYKLNVSEGFVNAILRKIQEIHILKEGRQHSGALILHLITKCLDVKTRYP